MAKRSPKPKTFPRITDRLVVGLAGLFRAEPFASTTARAYKLGAAVIGHVLGEEWVEENILHNTHGFLRSDQSTPLARETQFMRVALLGEMMWNLQWYEGYDACIAQLLNPTQIESTYAELEIARLLFAHSTGRFSFRDPAGRAKGDRYDLDIRYPDGLLVCGETKCKVEETEITLGTIKDSLETAVEQLPKLKPGVAFVKFPGAWLGNLDFVREMDDLAIRFLGSTKRMVSVKYYAASVTYRPLPNGAEEIGERIAYNEHSNRRHRFPDLEPREWDLFPKEPPNDGMPPWYKRLVYL